MTVNVITDRCGQNPLINAFLKLLATVTMLVMTGCN